MLEIKKAAVIGSGVMGSGIAAHLANCGIPSLLLDQPDLVLQRVPFALAEQRQVILHDCDRGAPCWRVLGKYLELQLHDQGAAQCRQY